MTDILDKDIKTRFIKVSKNYRKMCMKSRK